MFVVGLTGGIATGKSTVAKMFMEQDCPLLDADAIAREVVEPGCTAWKKIKDAFGPEVFKENGELDREKLGAIIFADSAKRELLNLITHPEISRAMAWKCFSYLIRGEQFIILDLPLLFERAIMLRFMSYTITVSCYEEQQLQRLCSRNNLTEIEAKQRIEAQLPLVEKCKQSTHIVDNSGSIEETQKQVDLILKDIRRSKRHWVLRGTVLVTLSVIFGFMLFMLR